MIRELQIIFGIDLIPRKLRIARQIAIFLQQLRRIALARLSNRLPFSPLRLPPLFGDHYSGHGCGSRPDGYSSMIGSLLSMPSLNALPLATLRYAFSLARVRANPCPDLHHQTPFPRPTIMAGFAVIPDLLRLPPLDVSRKENQEEIAAQIDGAAKSPLAAVWDNAGCRRVVENRDGKPLFGE